MTLAASIAVALSAGAQSADFFQPYKTTDLRLPSVPRPDDAADALGVALCHAFTNRFSGLFGIR